jgi:hypothetical protein
MRLESRNKILIGIDDDDVIIYLEAVFWDGDFKGATGIGLEYITKSRAESLWEDAEENPTDYVDRYFWIEAAKYGENASYEEFAEREIGYQRDNDFPWPDADGSSTSFVSENDEKFIRDYLGETEPLLFDWFREGRMFDKNYELRIVANPEALEIIKEFESEENMTEERARELIAKIDAM